MDIHKAKPWHGWREFLKEYLIVVVGVLTALAAEQAVEWLHWRHLAHQTEAQLAAGVQVDLKNSARWQILQACEYQRVGELADALQGPAGPWLANPWRRADAASRQPQPVPTIVPTPSLLWTHVEWETALGTGVFNHLRREQVDRYAEIYRLVEVLRETQKQSLEADAQLAPLGYNRVLSQAERTEYLARLAQVHALHQRMFNSSRQVLIDAHALGLDLEPKAFAALQTGDARILGPCALTFRLPSH